MVSGAPESVIRSLVERYKVCWDSFPEWSQTDGERTPTGVVVELYGTHDAPDVVPTAGCKHCIPVIQALLVIADHAADPARDRLMSIRAHSGIEYAVERGARPDVVVDLTFTPALRPTPGGASGAPEAVRERLRALGAAERSWRESGRR